MYQEESSGLSILTPINFPLLFYGMEIMKWEGGLEMEYILYG